MSRARFDFYLKSGNSFVAEEGGKVTGYVASQTTSFMHGDDRQLWIEYVVVQPAFLRRGVGHTLLCRLINYTRSYRVNRIRTTINPDNEASIGLHCNVGFNVRDWKTASYKIRR